MRRISRGFTIIELLIVIAVIGILSTISIVGFNRFQADARDAQRSSKATIIAEALEKYYDKNGEYPSCPAITAAASTVTTTTLPGMEQNTLLTPKSTSDDNSIECLSDLTTNDADVFAYIGDGSPTCSTGSSCLAFTLKYKDEGTGTIASISGRRQTNINTGAAITDLTCNTYSFSQINCSWTAIDNASSYNVQRATNDTFTTNMVQSTTSTNSVSITGLSLSTLYYVRVQPVALTITGSWSNPPASATTYSLDTPNPSCDGGSPSQITCTWASVPNATSYSLQWDTDCSFSASPAPSPTTVDPSTSPIVFSGLGVGITRAVHVKAVAAGFTSGWSSCASAATTVPVPTGLALTVNSTIQITANWNAVSSATSYDLDYSSGSSFSPGTYTTINTTNTSQAVTGLTDGTPYYFRVRAYINANSSANSATVNAPTTSVVLSGQGSCSDSYSARPNYRVDLVWTEVSYNIAANTSNVTWVTYRTPNIQVSGTWDETLPAGWTFNAAINGQTVLSGGQGRSGRWRSRTAYIGNTEAFYGVNTTANSSYSGTITVAHNADGTKTVATYVYDGSTGIFGTASCSGSYVLSDLR